MSFMSKLDFVTRKFYSREIRKCKNENTKCDEI